MMLGNTFHASLYGSCAAITVCVCQFDDPDPITATVELRELLPESPHLRHPLDWPEGRVFTDKWGDGGLEWGGPVG